MIDEQNMTLAEIVEALPEHHPARGQYLALKATAGGRPGGGGIVDLSYQERSSGRRRSLRFSGPVPRVGDVVAICAGTDRGGGWFRIEAVAWYGDMRREGDLLSCSCYCEPMAEHPLRFLERVSPGHPEGFPRENKEDTP